YQKAIAVSHPLIRELDRLGDELTQALAPLSDEQSIRAVQAQYLGKKGKVSELMKQLGKPPPDDRKLVGEAVNRVKDAITASVGRKLAELAGAARAADLARTVD